MCSIWGWLDDGGVAAKVKADIAAAGISRGRDGGGVWFDHREWRWLTEPSPEEWLEVGRSRLAIGNHRACPTTEAETDINVLQPYDGIVHNGTVANASEFGDYEIDSMALPAVFEGADTFEDFCRRCLHIKGGYAIATIRGQGLFLACNYKPLYYTRFPMKGKHFFAFASTPEQLSPVLDYSVVAKLPPYSAMSVTAYDLDVVELPRPIPDKNVLVSCSAGLDSTTVAYILKNQGYHVHLLHFTYACKAEAREVEKIRLISEHGGFGLTIIDLPRIMSGTITEGTYNTDQKFGVRFAADWVSARNLLMLAAMAAYAETNGFGYIAFGGNLEEGGSFPDNEPEFGRLFNGLLPYAVKEGYSLQLINPIANLMKHEIVREGLKNGVPYELTWSCYGDGAVHCGQCSPCYMREKAFERNHAQDPAAVKYKNPSI